MFEIWARDDKFTLVRVEKVLVVLNDWCELLELKSKLTPVEFEFSVSELGLCKNVFWSKFIFDIWLIPAKCIVEEQLCHLEIV